jgi:folate-binding protein YgfZ
MQSGRLEHLGLLRFAGPDAVQFLQGQLSNDTRLLTAGRTILAAYSNVQGRVVAILHLLPHSSGLLAVLPRELAEPVRERLRKFVLRAKVQIENLSDALSVHGYHDEAALRAAGFAPPGFAPPGDGAGVGVGDGARDEAVAIAAVVGDPRRTWVVGAPSGTDTAQAAAQATVDWQLADIRAGLPQIHAATSELFVAQMLNLDLLGGISFNKGCYTGQEIIARTQHRGRIKRRTLRVALPPGTWARADAVQLVDGRGGRLLELAPVEAGYEALAVVSLDLGDGEPAESPEATPPVDSAERARVGRELPLPYPLTQA